ncbi:MAG: acetoacetate--CoA ligase [Chryseolinea sp.]
MSNLLWSPTEEFARTANINLFMTWLRENERLDFRDYHSLWEWSVNNKEAFWKSILVYFKVEFDGSFSAATNGKPMPDTQWFEGIRLSYAEHIFKGKQRSQVAVIYHNESGLRVETSWGDLENDVASIRHQLVLLGVAEGDRVAAFMPATTEATTAFLATNSLGALWSICSPDFGVPAVIDRFAQIEPKVLFAVDHYEYGGKRFETNETVAQICASLPSVMTVVIVSDDTVIRLSGKKSIKWSEAIAYANTRLEFKRVPFNHPIWILYSSGTTGAPKAIVHTTGGILVEQYKYGSFHNDFKSGQLCTWYTTTGWMMWNYIHGCLLAGCTMLLYDGSPGYPDLYKLWKIVADEKINHFGTSASFILANQKRSITPSEGLDFSSLRSIGSTGSTLPPEGFEWVYEHVKSDVWLASMSGGTDICSAFVGGNPTLPVYTGEIQCRTLGCKLESFDEQGHAVYEQLGEMVITEPMPSMPAFFWNDPDKKRYRESYFEMYPGIWRHGDWISITEHDGLIIHGRSDATLNRGGIRIGTSEVYRAVDEVKGVSDSLIVCIERDGGNFWMPLFVVMKDGIALTTEVKDLINQSLRKHYSPRHVPDDIIQVPDIPYTLSGKKSETPIKKILMGGNPTLAVNRDVLRNPDSLDFFIEMARA